MLKMCHWPSGIPAGHCQGPHWSPLGPPTVHGYRGESLFAFICGLCHLTQIFWLWAFLLYLFLPSCPLCGWISVTSLKDRNNCYLRWGYISLFWNVLKAPQGDFGTTLQCKPVMESPSHCTIDEKIQDHRSAVSYSKSHHWFGAN